MINEIIPEPLQEHGLQNGKPARYHIHQYDLSDTFDLILLCSKMTSIPMIDWSISHSSTHADTNNYHDLMRSSFVNFRSLISSFSKWRAAEIKAVRMLDDRRKYDWQIGVWYIQLSNSPVARKTFLLLLLLFLLCIIIRNRRRSH